MFKNPGRKLKGIAKVVFALLVIVYVLLGVGLMLGVIGDGSLYGAQLYIAGAAVILVGILIAWLSSIALYAVGSAVDDIQTIKKIQVDLYKRSTEK